MNIIIQSKLIAVLTTIFSLLLSPNSITAQTAQSLAECPKCGGLLYPRDGSKHVCKITQQRNSGNSSSNNNQQKQQQINDQLELKRIQQQYDQKIERNRQTINSLSDGIITILDHFSNKKEQAYQQKMQESERKSIEADERQLKRKVNLYNKLLVTGRFTLIDCNMCHGTGEWTTYDGDKLTCPTCEGLQKNPKSIFDTHIEAMQSIVRFYDDSTAYYGWSTYSKDCAGVVKDPKYASLFKKRWNDFVQTNIVDQSAFFKENSGSDNSFIILSALDNTPHNCFEGTLYVSDIINTSTLKNPNLQSLKNDFASFIQSKYGGTNLILKPIGNTTTIEECLEFQYAAIKINLGNSGGDLKIVDEFNPYRIESSHEANKGESITRDLGIANIQKHEPLDDDNISILQMTEERQNQMKQNGSILRVASDEVSEAIYWIPKNSKVQLLRKEGSFAKVLINGKTGYITLKDYKTFFEAK
jgi:hypothetical protein